MNKGLKQAQGQLLPQGIAQIGIDLSDDMLAKVEQHLAMVDKWRSKINLVSVSNRFELITHHALDSLAIAPLLAQSQSVLDIGSGAGFPGIPLACVLPETDFTLLDSRQRRVEFMRLVVANSGLDNVALESARVENYPKVRGSKDQSTPIVFDTLVARAVASLASLIKFSAHLRHPGQRFIAMKGICPQAELDELQQIHGSDIKQIEIIQLQVPGLDAERHAVIMQF